MKILIAVLAFVAFNHTAHATSESDSTATVCIEVNGETICN